MESLVRHLVEPIVAHPDAVNVQAVEGEAVILLELVVHADDRGIVEGDRGKTLKSIQNILSAAAGRKKAHIDLVEEFSPVDDDADSEE